MASAEVFGVDIFFYNRADRGKMSEDRVRIDKWLWAARFFKTRSLAAQAVAGGKVHINGARIKPARMVQAGDELRIRRGEVEFVVIVQDVAEKRGPAKEAQLLYTPKSPATEDRSPPGT